MGRYWPWSVLALAATLAVVGAVVRAARVQARAEAAGARAGGLPLAGRRSGYATSSSCRACHPGAFASWHRSHHRTMTQVATEGAVLGAFDGRELDEAGNYAVGRDEERFWVEMPAGDGRHVRRTVVLTTGSHHMQVYWVHPEGDGRLTAFPWAWLRDERRWVPNEATLLRPPRTDVEYTWNRVCIKCHVVAGIPGWDAETQRARSEVAELGIACEACHGPGAKHVERYRDPLRRYAEHLADAPVDDIVDPGRLDSGAASQLCAQCHAITFFHDDDAWVRSGHEHPPPAPMASWGRLVRHPLRADQPWMDAVLENDANFLVDRFWSDGMVRVSGREYNGLVESACHQEGELSCLTCHSMHAAEPDDQLGAEAKDDRVCLRCHEAVAMDMEAHTHHPSGEGPGCYDCHMPHTTYGLLKAIRSHEIDSPNVQTALDTGRPNACNLCHLDRTLAWAAEHLGAWYGQPPPKPAPKSDAAAAAVVWLLSGDAGQRALLAWHFGWSPALQASGRRWQAPILASMLDDPYAAVRQIALRSLRRLPGFADFDVDPLASPNRRASAPGRARRRWMELGAMPDAPAGHERVLLRDDGSWDVEATQRLLRAKDMRPVSLAE